MLYLMKDFRHADLTERRNFKVEPVPQREHFVAYGLEAVRKEA